MAHPKLTTHASGPAVRSLYVEAYGAGKVALGGATAFIVRSPEFDSETSAWTDGFALITARHVVTGKHADTDEPLHKSAACPERLRVWRPSGSPATLGRDFGINLLPNGEEAWTEDNPLLGKAADVAVMRLPREVSAWAVRAAYECDYEDSGLADLTLALGGGLYVVGFPVGIEGDHELPVWTRGSVASEPNTGWRGDRFLIDSRTRGGQSGSPVIAHVAGGTVRTPDGHFLRTKEQSILVGLYASRINDDSDIGSVWNVSLIRELLADSLHRDSVPVFQWK